MKPQTHYCGEIAKTGCLFLSILNIIEEKTGVNISDRDVEQIYKKAVDALAITEKCFVLDHTALGSVALDHFWIKGRFIYKGAFYLPWMPERYQSWGDISGSDSAIIQGKVLGAHSHFFRPAYNPAPDLTIPLILSVRGYKIV